MRLLGYAVALVVGLASGMGIMVMLMNPLPSLIDIEIVNRSEQSLTHVVIQHEDGMVSIQSLDPGTKKVVPVMVEGESSYHIHATLANGNIVKGQGGYVEPGYSLRETITSTGIEHEHLSFY